MSAAAAAEQQAMAAALQGHDRLRRSTEMPRSPHISLSTASRQLPKWPTGTTPGSCPRFTSSSETAQFSGGTLYSTPTSTGSITPPLKQIFLPATNLVTQRRQLVLISKNWYNDYYLRVQDSFAKMCEAKPVNIGTVQVVPPTAVAVPASDLTIMKTEGIRDTEKFFKHQLFLAGLNEMLQIKVWKLTKTLCMRVCV